MKIQTWGILGRSFHFGLHGMGQEKTSPTFSSDSLFAALVARLARSGDAAEVEKFCQPFVDGKAPFVLSSTFPMAGKIRFFPPPITARVPSASIRAGSAKSIKRVLFVSEVLYRRLLNGEMLSALGDVTVLQEGKLWISQAEAADLPASMRGLDARLWAEEQRPRVTLDRASQASTLFFTGQITFAEDCGLWFGVRWLQDDPALKQMFASLLYDLADAGLGAERSSGLGAAVINQMSEIELPDPIKRWTSLSRYLPKNSETASLVDPDSAYALKSVGGWLASPASSGQRRKTVNLLVEGSVFGNLPSGVPGQMADVRPSYEKDPDPLGHPVYRCGLALAVGLKGAAL